MIRRVLWLLLAVVVFVIAGMYAMSFMAKRPTDLGIQTGNLAGCPVSPNCVSTQADDAEHQIQPIELSETPQQAIERLKQIVTGMPRMTVVEETDDYLHIEAASLVFRFVDDLEFYADATNQQIQLRSAARSGWSDFGANRARMEKIREAYLAAAGSSPDSDP